MKHMRKMMALVIAMVMTFAMGVTAFAYGHGSITINNAVEGHTYTAYKIFAGTYDTTSGKLSNLDWGTEITDAGKNALYTKYGLDGTDGKEKTAENVAKAIGDSDTDAIAFANEIGTNVSGGTTGTLSGTTYTISNLDDGYYMIVDTWTKDQTSVEGKDYSLARYMIQIVGDATVNNKADKPTVEKKIDGATDTDPDTTTKTDYNNANIGDKVPYVVTSAVPNYVDYKEYYMEFSDTLSKGLTFNQTTSDGTLKGVTVKIGDTTLAADAFTVTIGEYDETNGTAISIHLKDFVSRKYAVGSKIEITYSATVNDNAVIGIDGNPNTVKLKYSNNPLNSGNGTPDDEENWVKGETPEDKVVTFVTELELTKVDGTDITKKLEGAVFHIKGSRINKVIKTGTEFVEDESGTYYKLKDNKGYTDKAPTESTTTQYEDTSKKYKKQAFATTSEEETNDVEFEAVTGSDGIIKLTGLATGTYTFTEIQAPAGYNLLTDPITVTITEENPTVDYDGTQKATWKYAIGSGNATVDDDGKIQFNVENKQGSTLPSTGGIGTTIFYIVGAILVVGAGIVLVTRRRMSAN